jgi:hypothetical protein
MRRLTEVDKSFRTRSSRPLTKQRTISLRATRSFTATLLHQQVKGDMETRVSNLGPVLIPE